MNERNRQAIEKILEHEGGYVDNPRDRGGATNHGVTQATLALWRGEDVTKDDVRRLSRDEAMRIYEARYIIAPGFDRIPHDEVFALVADMSVNHGPKNAAKMLQKALGTVRIDGACGPITIAATAACDPAGLVYALRRERALFYARIVKGDPSQSVFIVGWIKRAFT